MKKWLQMLQILQIILIFFFSKIAVQAAESIPPHINIDFDKYLSNKTDSVFEFSPVNVCDIEIIISKLPNKKSFGYDNISSHLIRKLKSTIAPMLSTITNQCLQSCVFPQNLKIAKIKPLFKKGNRSLFNNYRPVSLLPCISKVIERVIFNQLYTYFTENNLLCANQYGFRKKHSTELAGIELVDHIANYLNNRKTPISIFLDLSKAFDTLNHNILLKKLDFYGLSSKSLILFASYLSNRKQYCEYNGISSEILETNIGVPQGSILGPLLFSIYINDLTKSSNEFGFLMYADDTTLYSTIEHFSDHGEVSQNISRELSNVTTWLEVNKLSLNTEKTKLMVYHMPQKKVSYPNIYINHSIIECVSEFNFLGITIDKSLNWKGHIDKTCNKISKYTGVFYRMRQFLPQYILILIYKSLISPVFYYGLCLWGCNTNRVFLLQKRILRIITGSYYIAHTEPIFKALKLLNIDDLYTIQLLKLYYKIINNNVPTYLSDKLELKPNHYNTRREEYIQRNVRPTYVRNTCIYKLIDLVNDWKNNDNILHTKIIDRAKTHSMSSYTIFIKEMIISNYCEICTINNCYVCNKCIALN